MKTLLVCILVTGLIGTVAVALSMNKPENICIDGSVSIDKTDSFLAKPIANDIYSVLHIDENKWLGTVLRINTLSNFEYTVSEAFKLKPQSILLSNPGQRDTAIYRFKKEFEMHLTAVNEAPIGQPKSSIYVPLLREVNRLAQSKAKVRVAIYYTDCGENTNLFSILREKDRALLKKHPEEVRKLFEQLGKPGNLQGIKLYFIHQPVRDEESFKLMSGFFKKILEDAGAQVYVGANLIGEDN